MLRRHGMGFPRRLGATLAGTVLLGSPTVPSGVAADTGARPLVVRLALRDASAGEPIRILVSSVAPLSRVEGRAGAQDLFFVPLDASEDGGARGWSAWAVVEMEAKAGVRRVDVSGIGADGVRAVGHAELTIRRRTFPTQKLDVEPRYVEPPPEVRSRIEVERRKLADIHARRTPLRPVRHPFVLPVAGPPTSAFGLRRVFNGRPRAPHPGIDLRAPVGTTVLAPGDGVVALAEHLYFSGSTVVLDHGGGLFTIYAHLSRIDVSEGQHVRAAQPLGLSGATGRVTGPHLHWGARVGEHVFDPRALVDDRLFPSDPGTLEPRAGGPAARRSLAEPTAVRERFPAVEARSS